jgi:hypothetical protein
MALSTCSELKEAVATWLARSGDTQIVDNVGDFIAMAEAYINRHLRVRDMETHMIVTTVDGGTNLPDDYLAWRTMTWLGDVYAVLDYLHPDMLTRYFADNASGPPRAFTIEGGDLVVRPIDDSTELDFLYYAKPSPLVDDDDTNWLLTAHPDLYLSAALAEANAFLINPDHASLWGQKRDIILNDIKVLSEKTKGPTRVIPIGSFY